MRNLSSPTRDRTHTSCIWRWSLNHWTYREVLPSYFFCVLNFLLMFSFPFVECELLFLLKKGVASLYPNINQQRISPTLWVLGCSVMSDSLWPHGSPPGFSAHGILQDGILEWVTLSSSRGSSQPRDQTQVSCIAGRFFTSWSPEHALVLLNSTPKLARCWESLGLQDQNSQS